MSALREQAPAMTGMAVMFIITILLAMSIQDFYDHDELRAFGDAGSTKASLVLMELVFIFAFTALIIWMARRNMERFIRWGVLGVLTLAMCYTILPFATLVLIDDMPPMPSEDTGVDDAWILSVEDGGSDFLIHDTSGAENGSIMRMQNGGDEVLWSYDIIPDPGTFYLPQVSTTADGIVMCGGTRWVLIDAETGEEKDDHSMDCDLGLRYEPVADDWENCDGTDDVAQDWAIMGQIMHPIGHVRDTDADMGECTGEGATWVRAFPDGFQGHNILLSRDIGPDHFLIVSTQWAGMVVYPTEASASVEFGDLVDTVWEKSLSGDERFLSVAWGASPGDDIDDAPVLVLGTSAGHVSGWSVGEDASVDSAFEMPLEEPIRSLLLADCCGNISNDLWVIEGDSLRVFMGNSLSEQPHNLKVNGTARIMMTLHDDGGEGQLIIEQDGQWTAATFTSYRVDIVPSLIATALIAIALMTLLILFPEWYVVNAVGILVGAGVVTILGVSFVPWLIMLFMVLAAGYDAWAVYKSKHMLELADTMIGLKLPILLVAPQDTSYSFLDEGDQVMAEKSEKPENTDGSADWDAVDAAPMPRPAKKSSGEAMFMGLGDIIFPGMLSISAMTFLPEIAGPMGYAASTWVAIGTMIGGLFGYLFLMTYVARGRPQAGLPLLNGGAILGYFVSAAYFIGTAAFVFNVSLF